MKKHQDYIYEMEDYYNNPKETFIFLKELIKQTFEEQNISLFDIGCAKGEFLYYISKNMKVNNLYGLDYSENLINQAKKFDYLKNKVSFIVGSADNFKIKEKFDVVTMSGVLSYFDSPTNVLKNIKEILNKNGRVYILGFFNHENIDVQIKYRNNKYFNSYESGWNYHSIDTIKKILLELGMQLVNIHKFNLSFDLNKQDDPARSWHIEIIDEFNQKTKKFTNGLGLIYDMEVIEILNG